MNELESAQQAYDMVILASEARYWYFLIGSALAGFVAIQGFAKLRGDQKEGALRTAGLVLIVLNLVPTVYGLFSPAVELSLQRSLPFHFCAINGWLIAFNCFWKNTNVFTFSAFMGTIGGLYAVLTPQLTIGDAPAILAHYYFNHTAIVVMPIIMARTYGFRFPRWSWIWTYLAVAVLSTAVGAFNWYLNTYHPGDITANYMYMWEAPKVKNPFLKGAPWPWYILPLHSALILHLVVINFAYRLGAPLEGMEGKAWWRRRLA